MKDNGLVTYGTVLAGKNGRMEPYTRDNGVTTRRKERGSSRIPMATTMRENGRMIRPMGMASSSTPRLGPPMKVTGRMTCNMAQE